VTCQFVEDMPHVAIYSITFHLLLFSTLEERLAGHPHSVKTLFTPHSFYHVIRRSYAATTYDTVSHIYNLKSIEPSDRVQCVRRDGGRKEHCKGCCCERSSEPFWSHISRQFIISAGPKDRSPKVHHGLASSAEPVAAFEVTKDKHIALLVDTPGFNDTERTDRQVLEDIIAFLNTT
jgi:hypothetical protein